MCFARESLYMLRWLIMFGGVEYGAEWLNLLFEKQFHNFELKWNLLFLNLIG